MNNHHVINWGSDDRSVHLDGHQRDSPVDDSTGPISVRHSSRRVRPARPYPRHRRYADGGPRVPSTREDESCPDEVSATCPQAPAPCCTQLPGSTIWSAEDSVQDNLDKIKGIWQPGIGTEEEQRGAGPTTTCCRQENFPYAGDCQHRTANDGEQPVRARRRGSVQLRARRDGMLQPRSPVRAAQGPLSCALLFGNKDAFL
ncbi:hypothetical protein pipiens_019276 [Culex pipiens pipiens]|uniref:Uncharacterized protein n=1 Tax=Culex pipiens pipiens TaxID=38569 RepID=A0ABD1DV60_CULPP